jgi:hypothetical protein
MVDYCTCLGYLGPLDTNILLVPLCSSLVKNEKIEKMLLRCNSNGNITVHQLGSFSNPFSVWLCLPGVLKEDTTVGQYEARPQPLVLKVLPWPEKEFGKVII